MAGCCFVSVQMGHLAFSRLFYHNMTQDLKVYLHDYSALSVKSLIKLYICLSQDKISRTTDFDLLSQHISGKIAVHKQVTIILNTPFKGPVVITMMTMNVIKLIVSSSNLKIISNP